MERNFIESVIQEKFNSIDEPTIVLRAAKTLPLQYAVEIIDFASRQNYKIVLATQP